MEKEQPESSRQAPLEPPNPTESVTIQLPGKGERTLRYTIGSLARLKKQLGRPANGPGGFLAPFDDTLIPAFIFEGLRGPNGEDPDGITVADIESLPAAWLPYLAQHFAWAYTGSLPEKKREAAPLETATVRLN